eukprot:322767_1
MGHSHSGFASTKLKPPNNAQSTITPPVINHTSVDLSSNNAYPSAPLSPSIPIIASAPFSPSTDQSTNVPYYEQKDYQETQSPNPYTNGFVNPYYATLHQPKRLRKPRKRTHSYRERKESVTEATACTDIHKEHNFSELAKAKIPKQNRVVKISSMYKYMKQLGTGASSRVLLVEHIQTNKKYAMKELLRNNINNHYLFLFEIKILNMLKGDEGIVQIHDVYMDEVSYYIVMEYCSGGDLLCKVLESHHFSEQQAVKYIKSILQIMDGMHDKNVCHRDLKPNNIVFNEDNVLKIIDFGQSEIIENNEKMYPFKGMCGTTCFIPPEFHRSRSGLELKKGDSWSIGCVCFLLMAGKSLFGGNSSKGIWTKICIFNEEYLEKAWPTNIVLSAECKDFIAALLNRNAHQRMSIKQALQHKWITMDIEKVSDKYLGEQVMIGIHKIVETNKLQKILADAILEEMDEKEVQMLMANIKDKDDVIGKLIEYHHTNYHVMDLDDTHTANHEALMHRRAHHVMNTLTEYKLNLDGLKFNDHKSDNEEEEELDEEEEELTFDSMSMQNHIKSVSVSEFRTIMRRSKKMYNVEKLVGDLDPNRTGFIAFDAIAQFMKPVKTHKLLPGLTP